MNRLALLSYRLLLLYLASSLALCAIRAQSQGEATPSVDAQVGISENLTSIESRKQALVALAAAAERLRQAGDVIALARTLNRAGEVQVKLNDLDAALADAREALALARQSGDALLLVDSLNFSASVYRFRQDNKTALQLLNEAHSLSLRLKYRKGEAQSLTELGATYFEQSALAKAEASNSKALQIWRELQDKSSEARTLLSLGEVYMRLGSLRESEESLENALALWHELGRSAEQASTLIDLTFLAIRQGQWQKALTLLNEAISFVNDKEAEPYISGQIAMGFGYVYEAYGQLETALSYYKEALIFYRDYAHDVSAAIDASRKAGQAQARIGDYHQAIQQIEEGLQLAQKIDNRFMAALCHEELGKVHLNTGLYVQAKQEFLEAIDGYERTGNRREWARAQSFLGQTDYLQGDQTGAEQSYRKALQVFQKIEDYTNEAALSFGLGQLELKRQNLEAAGTYLKRSIALTEQLRENAPSKDLRSSFLASVHDRYETYVEWLMQLHARQPDKQFDIAAFEASESGRARSLLDTLKDYQRELRQVADPVLLIEEEKLQKSEQQLLDKRAKLQSEGAAPEAKEKVESELKNVRAQYETLEAHINSTAKFKNLMGRTSLKFSDIKEQITDNQTSLLEYSLGDQKSYLWFVTPDGLTTYELAGKETIEKAAHKLSDLLSQPPIGTTQEAELQAAIEDLSRLLLGQVAGKLHSPRLIIVPDGFLQYIPFQMLTASPDTGEPLVAHFEIVNEPSVSTLAVVQQERGSRPSASKLLAAFGAPKLSSNYGSQNRTASRGQTNEPEVNRGQQTQRGSEDETEETLEPTQLRPLFFDKQELNELRKLAPADESVFYTEFDANRDNLRKLDLRQYRILHFATHGLLNDKQPELSGLVLSLVDRNGQPATGFVGLSDIYNLHAPVDLVVLSACHTARGKDVRGEGLISLTRGFMYAGASSVVASLWKVDDEATSELMKLFYTNMLQDGMTPAAALRAAQNSIRQNPNWRSPHYWAAFTLQGEYRQVIKPTPAYETPISRKIGVGVALLMLMTGAVWWYRRQRAVRSAH